jgi:hypothetical protein
MTLEKPNVIDALNLESATGCAVLTIADSWDWSDERGHLLALQAKLNAYFAFVESDQIWEENPAGMGKPIVILVIGRCEIPESGIRLLQAASEAAGQLGIEIRRMYYPGSST